VLKISWNPGHDSDVIVSLGELYALTHATQRNDAFRRRIKQMSDHKRAERADVKCQLSGTRGRRVLTRAGLRPLDRLEHKPNPT
jgi:hypothetical protein